MARLILATAEGPQAIDLRPVNSLGRHPNNSIQLLDKIVSKEHCIVEARDGQFVLRDLGSLNGTYINGERVRGEQFLRHGDEIALGSTRARFDDGTAPLNFAPLAAGPGAVQNASPALAAPAPATAPGTALGTPASAPASAPYSARAPHPAPPATAVQPSGASSAWRPQAGPHAGPPPSPLAQTPGALRQTPGTYGYAAPFADHVAAPPAGPTASGSRVQHTLPLDPQPNPLPPNLPQRSVPQPNLRGTRVDMLDSVRSIGTQIAALAKGFLPYEQVAQDTQQLRVDYERLRITWELTRDIGLERDLTKLLEKILFALFKFVKADRGVILLTEADGSLQPRVARRRDGSDAPIQVSSTILKKIVEEKTAVLTHDASMDFAGSKGRSMILNRISSAMVVPLLYESEVLGAVWLDSENLAQFQPKDLELITAVNNQAAMFIENIQLGKKIEQEIVTRERFSRLLSPNVAEQVISGRLEVKKGGTLVQECTVFNSDIRGFTRMSEGASAETMVELLNEYFEQMVEVIFKYEGTLDKFMGDGIMAFWGAPAVHPDDAVRSVQAALDQMEALAKFNRRQGAGSDLPLAIGMGIHTGPLVAGYVGSSKALSYTVIGDTANTSARLCGVALAGQIIITEVTLARLGGRFEVEELPPAHLKGKEKPTRIFNVKREKLSATKVTVNVAAYVLPFEKPVALLVARVKELRALAEEDRQYEPELRRLEEKSSRLARELFADLTPWQKVQLCRHPNRPYTLDYIEEIFEDFQELHGDRRFGDDPAIVGGFARYRGRSVIVVGHQKGRSTKEKVTRNFGQAHPEGNRKASRLYDLGSRFGLPILTFIDTQGAYPGIGAEERGQSEAIGACLAVMARARVPIIATIIGEGGSGGALALGVANRVHVLEYGTYSVISPEGCASILWKDGGKAEEAAARMKMTAPDLLRLKVVDRVIEEPAGGAHQDLKSAARSIDAALGEALAALLPLTPDELVKDRYERFRQLGAFVA